VEGSPLVGLKCSTSSCCRSFRRTLHDHPSSRFARVFLCDWPRGTRSVRPQDQSILERVWNITLRLRHHLLLPRKLHGHHPTGATVDSLPPPSSGYHLFALSSTPKASSRLIRHLSTSLSNAIITNLHSQHPRPPLLPLITSPAHMLLVGSRNLCSPLSSKGDRSPRPHTFIFL
jgi:hypothetical protein